MYLEFRYVRAAGILHKSLHMRFTCSHMPNEDGGEDNNNKKIVTIANTYITISVCQAQLSAIHMYNSLLLRTNLEAGTSINCPPTYGLRSQANLTSNLINTWS